VKEREKTDLGFSGHVRPLPSPPAVCLFVALTITSSVTAHVVSIVSELEEGINRTEQLNASQRHSLLHQIPRSGGGSSDGREGRDGDGGGEERGELESGFGDESKSALSADKEAGKIRTDGGFPVRKEDERERGAKKRERVGRTWHVAES
jgi:hypothetical protein